jgi:hypothetical protein
MGNDKKPVTPEEVKLMKGEIQQLLASIRDYLLNMKLPSPQPGAAPAELGDSETQPSRERGNSGGQAGGYAH